MHAYIVRLRADRETVDGSEWDGAFMDLECLAVKLQDVLVRNNLCKHVSKWAGVCNEIYLRSSFISRAKLAYSRDWCLANQIM